MNNRLSPERQRGGSKAGFTLLEIVFVLGMIAMLAVWLTLSVTTVDTEQRLRESSGSIESLVKRARSVAIMQQRPYQIKISELEISMQPKYPRLRDTGSDESGTDEDDVSNEVFQDVSAVETMDEEVKYEIRRWQSDEWVEIERDREIVLTIDPLGLVEPISIRCSVGDSWLIQDLHPLTGGIANEEMSIESD